MLLGAMVSCGDGGGTGPGGGGSNPPAPHWPVRPQCTSGQVACQCEGGGAGVATCQGGAYSTCVCSTGCTPRASCELILREIREQEIIPPFGPERLACGAVPDGCGGVLQCSPCPSMQIRQLGGTHAWVAVGRGRYYLAAEPVYRESSFYLLMEVDIESGMLMRQWPMPFWSAFALDASLRYLVRANQPGDYVRTDLVTGREEIFATFRHTDGTIPRIVALYNLRSSEDRWLVAVHHEMRNLYEVWMVQRGVVVERRVGRSVHGFYETTNGLLLAFRDERDVLGPPIRSSLGSIYEVLPAGLQGPRDGRGGGSPGTWQCDGSICYTSNGGRIDFSISRYPAVTRVFDDMYEDALFYDGATGEVLLRGNVAIGQGMFQHFIGRTSHSTLNPLMPRSRESFRLFDDTVGGRYPFDYIWRVSADQVMVKGERLIRHPMLRR